LPSINLNVCFGDDTLYTAAAASGDREEERAEEDEEDEADFLGLGGIKGI
jgi:hypothetical protein